MHTFAGLRSSSVHTPPLSSSLLVFKLGGNGLRLLDRRGYLTPDAETAIAALPGDEVPPAERGYFVHLRRGKPWSGKRSRFDATT